MKLQIVYSDNSGINQCL